MVLHIAVDLIIFSHCIFAFGVQINRLSSATATNLRVVTLIIREKRKFLSKTQKNKQKKTRCRTPWMLVMFTSDLAKHGGTGWKTQSYIRYKRRGICFAFGDFGLFSCLFVCLFVSIYACFCLLVCMLVFHVSLYAGLLEIKQLITANLIYIYYFTSPENFKVVSVWTLIKRVITTFAFRALTEI